MSTLQNVSWDFSDRPRTQIAKDLGGTLTLNMYVAGTQVTPTSATLTVLLPGGSALATPVTDAAATLSTSTLTYALSAGNSSVLGANYTAKWLVTYQSVVYPVIQLFDVVRTPLLNVVVPADLARRHPDLTDSLYSTESNAQKYIEDAYFDVFQIIDAKGKRPHLVLSSESLRRPIEELALSKFFAARIKTRDDRWAYLYEMHKSEFDRTIQTIPYVYDIDDSGTVSGTSEYVSGLGEEGRTFVAGWKV